jgi:hypothetical protein
VCIDRRANLAFVAGPFLKRVLKVSSSFTMIPRASTIDYIREPDFLYSFPAHISDGVRETGCFSANFPLAGGI